MSHVAWSVCLSDFVLDMWVSCARTAESIEMPFGRLTLVGPRNHVLDDTGFLRARYSSCDLNQLKGTQVILTKSRESRPRASDFLIHCGKGAFLFVTNTQTQCLKW